MLLNIRLVGLPRGDLHNESQCNVVEIVILEGRPRRRKQVNCTQRLNGLLLRASHNVNKNRLIPVNRGREKVIFMMGSF